MSEVRNGRDKILDELGIDLPAGTCLFCGREVESGAYWLAAGSTVYVCGCCVSEGRLGLLIGDALRNADALTAALVATEREAWRSHVLLKERERSRGRV